MENEKKEVKYVSEIKDFVRTSAKETSQVENKNELDQERIKLTADVIIQIIEKSLKEFEDPTGEIKEIMKGVDTESEKQEIAKMVIKKCLDSPYKKEHELAYILYIENVIGFLPSEERGEFYKQAVQRLINEGYLYEAEKKAFRIGGEIGASLLLQIGEKYLEQDRIEDAKVVAKVIYQLKQNKKEEEPK
jgi:hypothetical protein